MQGMDDRKSGGEVTDFLMLVELCKSSFIARAAMLVDLARLAVLATFSVHPSA